MSDFEQFRHELREALGHLHDPDYRPPQLLCAILSHAPGEGAGPVQSDVIRIIKGLEPADDIPPDAGAKRDYDLLHHRYLLKLTQEETAECLHLSVRSVRRAQRVATHTLAQLLWEHSLARQAAEGEEAAQPSPAGRATSPRGQALDWRSQVQKDLESLLSQASETIADVGETIARAVELEAALSARHGVHLRLEGVQAHLLAAAHPSALRQILIMAIGQLTRHTTLGEIAIRAASHGRQVEIELSTAATPGQEPPDVRLMREMLASQRGRLQINLTDQRLSFRILVPAAGRITVLVVDDNLDQVHFYRRCAAGTRYHIVHAPYGQRTVQAIAAAEPDIIVLDILLPEVDAWELLSDLQKHPTTRSTPVIICSIIEEEDLASALGAALYLPKPIHHRAFIEALAQLVGPTATEGTTG